MKSKLFSGIIGFILTPFGIACSIMPEGAGPGEVNKNQVVEKTKEVAKNVVGFLGLSLLWGIGAAIVGFAGSYGLSKGTQYAQRTGTPGLDNQPGSDDTMTTAQAGTRGGQTRRQAA